MEPDTPRVGQERASNPRLSIAFLLAGARCYTKDCPGARGRLAQLVRAPALQAGCRGFESLTAHHHLVRTSNNIKRRANSNKCRGFRCSTSSGILWRPKVLGGTSHLVKIWLTSCNSDQGQADDHIECLVCCAARIIAGDSGIQQLDAGRIDDVDAQFAVLGQ